MIGPIAGWRGIRRKTFPPLDQPFRITVTELLKLDASMIRILKSQSMGPSYGHLPTQLVFVDQAER